MPTVLLQVGSIIPGNCPIVMGMPDTFFDDDTLIQRMVISKHVAGRALFNAQIIFLQVDKLADGAEIIAGCFRIRPEQRGQLRMCAHIALAHPPQHKISAMYELSCAFSGKLGQCRIGDDGALLELVDKNKDCPFE